MQLKQTLSTKVILSRYRKAFGMSFWLMVVIICNQNIKMCILRFKVSPRHLQ